MIDLLRDVKGHDISAICDDLLGRYRTPGAVFRAFADPRHRDDKLPVTVAGVLRRVANAFMAALSTDAVDGRRICSEEALLTYLKFDMAPLSREHFRVLFMDSTNRLVADRVLWVGTVDAVQSHPREVLRSAIEVGATALILVHNHPNGRAVPSRHDIEATAQIEQACSGIGVTVHDHILIGFGKPYSMRANGVMGTNGRQQGQTDHRGVLTKAPLMRTIRTYLERNWYGSAAAG